MELINEFTEELTKMSGKCMDIGCGPGFATKKLLLPALHENAKMIGKKEANSSSPHNGSTTDENNKNCVIII